MKTSSFPIALSIVAHTLVQDVEVEEEMSQLPDWTGGKDVPNGREGK